MLYVDHPVGVGFSYNDNGEASALQTVRTER